MASSTRLMTAGLESVDALSKDPRALAVGERLFMNNCSQCHASDGGGSKGFPNLTNANSAWLGERTSEHIVQTVTNGRTGMMPPMGAGSARQGWIVQPGFWVTMEALVRNQRPNDLSRFDRNAG